jgi:quercetin dioxygenase-like cupin family protein
MPGGNPDFLGTANRGSYRSCRLPLRFDPVQLHDDLLHAVAAGWTPHFVPGNYAGDWSGIALRSVDGVMGHAHSRPDVPSEAYRPTPALQACSYLGHVLGQFQCRVGSARLLQLGPGSVIKEHTDHDLGYASGTLRLHVPIQTRPEVEFYVEGERVVMREGECWYVDTSLRHRVTNLSPESRVHLVFDCELNDWLREQLMQAGFEPRRPGPLEQRGVRVEDVDVVAARLRAMGNAVGERLANELEQACKRGDDRE